MDPITEAQQRKHRIRAEARARRDAQPNRDKLSERILAQVRILHEYSNAATVMLYASFRSEVQTRPLFAAALSAEKRVVVPYCSGNRLELFRVESLDDLAPGTLGILEPKAELRHREDRKVQPDIIDLVVVPGLAFDPHCGRIGYGKGYYDRLLEHARADTALVAVAFQTQIFPEVPVLPYDVRVDKVITEERVYQRALPRCAEAGIRD